MSEAISGILWNLLLPVKDKEEAYILPWKTDERSITRHQNNRTDAGIEVYLEYSDGEKEMLYYPFEAVPEDLSDRADAQTILVRPLHKLDIDFDEGRFQQALKLLDRNE